MGYEINYLVESKLTLESKGSFVNTGQTKDMVIFCVLNNLHVIGSLSGNFHHSMCHPINPLKM